MATAIVLKSCTGVVLTDVVIEGFDTGTSLEDCSSVDLNGVQFLETTTGVLGRRLKDFKAQNITHTSPAKQTQYGPLALAIRRIVHGNV